MARRCGSNRAQFALEYLMTYGWVLILIATIVSVLVFIISSPASSVSFSSSNPMKILVKGGAVSGTDAEIKLQNITGGGIDVTMVTLTSNYSGASCLLNGSSFSSGVGISPAIAVPAGSELYVECSNVAGNGSGTIDIDYTDFAGLSRSVTLMASGAGGGTGGPEEIGLVGYWQFNEGFGSATADSSGIGNNGTLVGPTLTWQLSGCPDGSCLQGFDDGAYNYVGVPHDDSLMMSTTVSVEAWAKAIEHDQWLSVLEKGSVSTSSEYWFGYNTSDKLTFMLNPGDQADSDRFYVSGFTSITDSGWHHLVGTFDSANVRVYIDGKLDNTPALHEIVIYASTGDFSIGTTRRFGYGYGFIGSIDNVKVYDRALSDSEVCEHCNAYAAAVGVTCNC